MSSTALSVVDDANHMTQVGTPLYCAPEILKDDFYDEHVDIYSFGIMLNEMDTRELPFTDPDTRASYFNAIKVSEEHLRPARWARSKSTRKVDDSTDELGTIIHQCWAQDPIDRPSAFELLASLEQLAANVDTAKMSEVRDSV